MTARDLGALARWFLRRALGFDPFTDRERAFELVVALIRHHGFSGGVGNHDHLG